MPSDPVEQTKQIKTASDIVAVVGGYLALAPAGRTFKALCPFHNDSRPSLDVDPRLQRYRCWSCQAHGDVFAFVQHMEKVGFKEARQILAVRAGIKLDETQSPQDQARVRLLGVMRWAQEKYQDCLLNDPAGAAAVAYIAGRKLSGKTVRDFGLGFAPLGGEWLTRLAFAERVPVEVLGEVGLLLERHGGRGHFDRFQDRVMFPIRDVQGRPVGFGGRIMPESPLLPRAPKYYNSAETPLFSKSELLYGLDLARHAGAAVGYLAVVEGYTDVMMAHQCGVPQVVATMGTALNARHVAQLRRYAPKVVLVYDADAGGMTGVDRALELFVGQDVELAVATLPDGLDPCDLLVRPGGLETFKAILTSAVDALDFKLNRLLDRDPNPSVEGTRRIIDEVLGVMAAAPVVPNRAGQVKQELIVTRLAHRLGLRQETVWARFGELKRERKQKDFQSAAKTGPLVQASAARETRPAPDQPAGKTGPVVAAEMQLLELLLAHPGFVPQAAAVMSADDLTHTGLRRMLVELYSLQAAGLTPDVDTLRDRLADRPDLFEAAEKRLFVGQHMQEPEQNLARILGWFSKHKKEVGERALTARLKGGALDPDQAAELLRKLQDRRAGG
ncbi:MAG: primase [Gemmataceae bacterium]|nr:primase [Gemmataceae bacterium]